MCNVSNGVPRREEADRGSDASRAHKQRGKKAGQREEDEHWIRAASSSRSAPSVRRPCWLVKGDLSPSNLREGKDRRNEGWRTTKGRAREGERGRGCYLTWRRANRGARSVPGRRRGATARARRSAGSGGARACGAPRPWSAGRSWRRPDGSERETQQRRPRATACSHSPSPLARSASSALPLSLLHYPASLAPARPAPLGKNILNSW